MVFEGSLISVFWLVVAFVGESRIVKESSRVIQHIIISFFLFLFLVLLLKEDRRGFMKPLDCHNYSVLLDFFNYRQVKMYLL